jgi:hypothetical protein
LSKHSARQPAIEIAAVLSESAWRQAALTSAKNRSTCARNFSDCGDSSLEALRVAAVPVSAAPWLTPLMFDDTTILPGSRPACLLDVARNLLRRHYLLSTAAAIVLAIWLSCRMVLLMPSIAVTDCCVEAVYARVSLRHRRVRKTKAETHGTVRARVLSAKSDIPTRSVRARCKRGSADHRGAAAPGNIQ